MVMMMMTMMEIMVMMMMMMEMVLKNEGWRGKRRSGGLRGHTQAAAGGALRLRQRHSGSEVIFFLTNTILSEILFQKFVQNLTLASGTNY